jgi:hypothetical protein
MPKLPAYAVNYEFIDGNPQSPQPLQLLLQDVLPEQCLTLMPGGNSAQVRGTFFLLHDLAHKGWKGFLSPIDADNEVTVIISPPDEELSKDIIRSAMEPRRLELIQQSAEWIRRVEPKIFEHFADGLDIDPYNIKPSLEICETRKQKDLFRYCRFLSSVPYSEYVGRRMHFLIRDDNLPSRPIIGIAAIGSSLLQITSRDKWIGWNGSDMREIKKKRIGNIMDLYVAVSIPPYSYLLGGKLVCYMIASDEVRKAFKKKYKDKRTLAKKRIIKDIVMLVTTSVYGEHSSQYNRIRYNDELLYIPVGKTQGFGTLHIGDESFNALRDYLAYQQQYHSNVFGEGANWRLRVIRDGMNALGFTADECLNHGHPRGVFAVPLAKNAKEYLTGKSRRIEYYNRPIKDMIEKWRGRWLDMRLNHPEIDFMENVRAFKADSLRLTHLLDS